MVGCTATIILGTQFPVTGLDLQDYMIPILVHTSRPRNARTPTRCCIIVVCLKEGISKKVASHRDLSSIVG